MLLIEFKSKKAESQGMFCLGQGQEDTSGCLVGRKTRREERGGRKKSQTKSLPCGAHVIMADRGIETLKRETSVL